MKELFNLKCAQENAFEKLKFKFDQWKSSFDWFYKVSQTNKLLFLTKSQTFLSLNRDTIFKWSPTAFNYNFHSAGQGDLLKFYF